MPPDFSFMISRYLYPVSQFQPTHVPSQESLVLNGSDAFVLITVGIKSVAESHRMFLEKYNKPLQNLFGLLYFPASVQTTIFILLIHMNLTIPCLCLSSTPQFLPPTFLRLLWQQRRDNKKQKDFLPTGQAAFCFLLFLYYDSSPMLTRSMCMAR